MSGTVAAKVQALLAPTRELTAFALVGTAAFLVHFSVVSSIVPLGVPPLVANVIGFIAAFAVSFTGHGRWSFPAANRRPIVALRRFFAVAIFGFAINECAYALLLRLTSLDYRVALFIVLAAVAVSTLLLSKYWAFADEG